MPPKKSKAKAVAAPAVHARLSCPRGFNTEFVRFEYEHSLPEAERKKRRKNQMKKQMPVEMAAQLGGTSVPARDTPAAAEVYSLEKVHRMVRAGVLRVVGIHSQGVRQLEGTDSGGSGHLFSQSIRVGSNGFLPVRFEIMCRASFQGRAAPKPKARPGPNDLTTQEPAQAILEYGTHAAAMHLSPNADEPNVFQSMKRVARGKEHALTQKACGHTYIWTHSLIFAREEDIGAELQVRRAVSHCKCHRAAMVDPATYASEEQLDATLAQVPPCVCVPKVGGFEVREFVSVLVNGQWVQTEDCEVYTLPIYSGEPAAVAQAQGTLVPVTRATTTGRQSLQIKRKADTLCESDEEEEEDDDDSSSSVCSAASATPSSSVSTSAAASFAAAAAAAASPSQQPPKRIKAKTQWASADQVTAAAQVANDAAQLPQLPVHVMVASPVAQPLLSQVQSSVSRPSTPLSQFDAMEMHDDFSHSSASSFSAPNSPIRTPSGQFSPVQQVDTLVGESPFGSAGSAVPSSPRKLHMHLDMDAIYSRDAAKTFVLESPAAAAHQQQQQEHPLFQSVQPQQYTFALTHVEHQLPVHSPIPLPSPSGSTFQSVDADLSGVAPWWQQQPLYTYPQQSYALQPRFLSSPPPMPGSAAHDPLVASYLVE